MLRAVVLAVTIVAAGFLLGVAYSMASFPEPVIDNQEIVARANVIGLITKQHESTRQQMTQMAEELLQLRGDLAKLSVAQPVPASPNPVVVVGGARTGAIAKPGEAKPTRTDGLAPDRPEELTALKSWKDDSALREKWSSATPAQIRQWLGVPDQVSEVGDVVTLTYWRKEQQGVVESTNIRTVGQRVVDVAVSAGK